MQVALMGQRQGGTTTNLPYSFPSMGTSQELFSLLAAGRTACPETLPHLVQWRDKDLETKELFPAFHPWLLLLLSLRRTAISVYTKLLDKIKLVILPIVYWEDQKVEVPRSPTSPNASHGLCPVFPYMIWHLLISSVLRSHEKNSHFTLAV